MKDSWLKYFLVNLRLLFSTNVRRQLNDYSKRITELESFASHFDFSRPYYLKVLDYFDHHEAASRPYEKELSFLRKFGKFTNFPYELNYGSKKVDSGFDLEAKLPYVMHRGNKLYFTEDYSLSKAEESYKTYLVEEKLLGRGDEEGAPHQYQSPRIQVSEGNVVFDIGAAEGLFALDNIERASKVIVVESDPLWINALQHTFAPFKEKVTILKTWVSETDTETTSSLSQLLSAFKETSAFIKMDIEGNEMPAIRSGIPTLKQMKNVQLAVATYHKQQDADELKRLFEDLGFETEFSNGYMLFFSYDTPEPPYFRHGIIRAKSK